MLLPEWLVSFPELGQAESTRLAEAQFLQPSPAAPQGGVSRQHKVTVECMVLNPGTPK